MNEELQQRLAGYMDAIEASASKAGEFVVEQTPLLAQEFLAWEFWSAVMGCVFGLAVLLVVIVFAICWWRYTSKNDRFDFFDHPENVFIIFFILVGFMVSGIAVGTNAYIATKVTVAPRVVLMEKVADLSK